MNNPRPTILLDDSPSSEDVLASGAHGRIARAIADLIRTSETLRNTAVIGIEGGWGSGKSTVVNLLERELSTDVSTRVFIFDAWAHEGDPLRRTYLEALARRFVEWGWISRDASENLSAELSGRKKQIHSKTRTTTTRLAQRFAVSALLVPVGTTFLSAALHNGIGLPGSFSWNFFVGLTLALSPAAVLIDNWRRVKARKRNQAAQKEEGEPNDWAFLSTNSVTSATQDVTESAEPTSIEFQDRFVNLVSDCIDEQEDRKLVMVLDNLDRVEPEIARTIWSTMQTFVQIGSQDDRWRRRLFVVVPFDPDGLRRLWSEYSKSTDTTRGDVLFESFMDKSFLIRFEVPPPVLSNWKAFLIDLVKVALPECHEDDQQIIYDVRRASLGAGKYPTPRELKLYVNQIGAICRQWHDEFEVGDVACFVAVKSSGHLLERLRTGEFRDLATNEVATSDQRLTLAALLFNTSRAEAQQLLLSEPILNALTMGDSSELNKLSQLHRAGFWAVLNSVVRDQIIIEPAQLGRVGRCFVGSNLMADEDHRPDLRAIIKKVASIARRVPDWLPLNEELAEGLSALLRLVNAADFSRDIAARLRINLGRTSKENPPTIDETTIRGLSIVIRNLEELGHQASLTAPFMLSDDASKWIDTAPLLGITMPDDLELVGCNAAFSDISQKFVATVTEGKFTEASRDAFRVTSVCYANPDWADLASSINQRFRNATIESDEGDLMLGVLFDLHQESMLHAKNVLLALVNDGYTMDLLARAKAEDHPKCIVSCVAAFLACKPDLMPPSSQASSADGYAILQGLLSACEPNIAEAVTHRLADLSSLQVLIPAWKVSEEKTGLVLHCLRLVADSETPASVFTPNVLFEELPTLVALNEEGNDRLSRLLDNEAIGGPVITQITETDGFKKADLQRYLAILTRKESAELERTCARGLGELSEEDWKGELATGGDALHMLFLLQSGSTITRLGSEYRDALLSYARELISSSVTPLALIVEKRERLFLPLDEAGRIEFQDYLYDDVEAAQGQFGGSFFDVFGAEAGQERILAKEDIIRKVFSPIVKQRNEPGLRWIHGLLTASSPALERHLRKQRELLVERVRSERKAPLHGDVTHDLLLDVLRALGEDEEKKARDE